MLGENIKTYRQKKGYTQEEVANRLHVTRQTSCDKTDYFKMGEKLFGSRC